jgi:hypothetical protein
MYLEVIFPEAHDDITQILNVASLLSSVPCGNMIKYYYVMIYYYSVMI